MLSPSSSGYVGKSDIQSNSILSESVKKCFSFKNFDIKKYVTKHNQIPDISNFEQNDKYQASLARSIQSTEEGKIFFKKIVDAKIAISGLLRHFELTDKQVLFEKVGNHPDPERTGEKALISMPVNLNYVRQHTCAPKTWLIEDDGSLSPLDFSNDYRALEFYNDKAATHLLSELAHAAVDASVHRKICIGYKDNCLDLKSGEILGVRYHMDSELGMVVVTSLEKISWLYNEDEQSEIIKLGSCFTLDN